MKRQLIAAGAVAATASAGAYLLMPTATPGLERASYVTTSTAAAKKAVCPAAKRQMRGMWIATTQNIDWPSRAGLSPAQQRSEYVKMLDTAASRGINAVFLQVRPASDAIYRSSLEPWSQYLTGKAGKDPGWDPLPFLIAEAHRRGMEFHAWFNPYRASYTDNVAALPANHPARQHPGWVVKHEGRLYYNPGLPSVRDHVTKVIMDVVNRYDVDGVHFDDYFYPYPGQGTKFNDTAAYDKYGQGKSLANWRRANVNQLVAQVDKAVHRAKPYLKFGISPFGIWRNKSNDPAGSKTNGMSAYDAIYADPKAWIKAGTVDYLTPQLYWNRGFAAADYDVLAPWWANAVKGSGVDLYIGQALYQVGTGGAWNRPNEIPSHLAVNKRHPEIEGDVYFSAKQVVQNPLKVMTRIADDYYRRPALLPLIKGLPTRPLGPVKALRAAGATLTWTGVPGARAYAVYRGTGSSCELVAVTTRSSFQTRANGTYQVTSLDRLYNESTPVSARVG